MASFSGFIRKSPDARLAAFLTAKGVQAPDDFNWQSEGRGTALVNDITGLIAELSDVEQDHVKAELDHLASLATPQTMTAAEQICSAQRIDLEGLQGIQDVLLMLALDHPRTLERVAAQASLMQRTGGKNWSAFQLEDDGKPWALGDDIARAGFVADAIAILDLPEHRKREADWYTSIRVHPITGEETEILQATIYVEASAESELTFGPSEGLERQVVQRVLEVGIACNAKERIVEICARGGKKIRDEYASSFSKHFAPQCQWLWGGHCRLSRRRQIQNS